MRKRKRTIDSGRRDALGRKIMLADRLMYETSQQEERRKHHAANAKRAQSIMSTLNNDGDVDSEGLRTDMFIIMNDYDKHIDQTQRTLDSIYAFQMGVDDSDLTEDEHRELTDRYMHYRGVLQTAINERATIGQSFDDRIGGPRVIQEEFKKDPSRRDWSSIITAYNPNPAPRTDNQEFREPSEPAEQQSPATDPVGPSSEPTRPFRPSGPPPDASASQFTPFNNGRSTPPASDNPVGRPRGRGQTNDGPNRPPPRQPSNSPNRPPPNRGNSQPNGNGGNRGRGPLGRINDNGSFRVTTRKHVGPFVVNFSTQGVSSVALRAGFLTYRLWNRDKNAKLGLSSVDLPGPLSYRPNKGSRARR